LRSSPASQAATREVTPVTIQTPTKLGPMFTPGAATSPPRAQAKNGPRCKACSTAPAADAIMAMLTTLHAVSGSAPAARTTMTRWTQNKKAYWNASSTR
jgi:hypothetical protein